MFLLGYQHRSSLLPPAYVQGHTCAHAPTSTYTFMVVTANGPMSSADAEELHQSVLCRGGDRAAWEQRLGGGKDEAAVGNFLSTLKPGSQSTSLAKGEMNNSRCSPEAAHSWRSCGDSSSHPGISLRADLGFVLFQLATALLECLQPWLLSLQTGLRDPLPPAPPLPTPPEPSVCEVTTCASRS